MKRNTVFGALPIVAAHYGATFGVKVKVGGSTAATDGDTIVVPNVPETYPKAVLWGYLTHEAAHVRLTDFSVWRTAAASGELRKHLLNILEDVRIEKAMMDRFPGTRADLDATVAYLRETGRFRPIQPGDHPGAVLQGRLLYGLRASVLQQPVCDLADEAAAAMRAVFPPAVDRRLDDLLAKVSLAASTADCLAIVDDILAMLQDEASDLTEEGDDDSRGGVSAADADLDAAGSDDQADHSSSREPGSETGPDSAGSGCASDDAAPDPGGAVRPLNAADAEQEGSSDDRCRHDGVSGAGDDGSGGSAATVADAASGIKSDGSDVAAAIQRALDATANDLADDAFEALKSDLLKEADAHGDGSYRTVPVAPSSAGNRRQGELLLAEVQDTTSKLRAQLLGLVQASRRQRDRACRSGRRIDSRRLPRLLAGDTRLFRHRETRKSPDTAVHVLTDLSSSMAGRDARIAQAASLAIALALEGIPRVSPAVTFFLGSEEDPVRAAIRHGESVRRNAHRFIERCTGTTPMAEGLWYAAYVLSKAREARKLIVVITDGDPNDEQACHTVIDLCRKAGIDMVGIGISHGGVERFFERSSIIRSVDELQSALFRLMQDSLAIQVA